MTLKHLRSSTADKRPQASGMAEGQLAINTASGSPGLFFKDSASNLVKVGPVHVGSGAPNASPASGGTSGNSLGEQWLDTSGGTYVFKIWDGSAWRSEAGEFVNTTGDTMTGALGIIAGSASAPGVFFSGDTNTGLYSPGADQVAISTSSSERIRIGANGEIGLGGTNYGTNGQVLTSAGSGAAPTWTTPAAGNTDKIEEGNTSAEVIDTGSDGRFVVTTEGSERLRVDSSGRLGIGTTSPTSALHIDVASGEPFRLRSQTAGSNYFTHVNHAGGDLAYVGAGGGAALNSGTTSDYAIRANQGALLFGTNGNNERARIDSSGRLLVGTSSSSAAASLVCQGTSASSTAGTQIWLQRGQAAASIGSGDTLGRINFADNAGNAYAIIEGATDASGGTNDYPGRLTFSTTADGSSSPTERMRVNSNGSVLINTTSEGAGIGFNPKLAVETSGTDTVVFKNSAGAGANCLYTWNAGTSGNNAFMAFGTEGTYTQRGSINYNRGSGVVAYNTTSDYRAKTLVGQVENPGATIDALKVYRGVMNGATVERPMLVAHEAQEVAPYCVTGEKDAVDDKGNPIYQQMDHQVLVPLLIAEIQQLRARVSALESA